MAKQLERIEDALLRIPDYVERLSTSAQPRTSRLWLLALFNREREPVYVIAIADEQDLQH